MKRSTEKPLTDDMQFFTRELYLHGSSNDPLEADRADEAWELAIKAYKTHMRALARNLPEGGKRLAKQCFHDAELMNPNRPVILARPGIGLIPLAHRTGTDQWQGYLIWYVLSADVRELPAPSNWPCSHERAQWLYDEFDHDPANTSNFIHRIFLSDGRVIVVPFKDAGVQKMARDAASLATHAMQLA
jgi:hypothetical protein